MIIYKGFFYNAKMSISTARRLLFNDYTYAHVFKQKYHSKSGVYGLRPYEKLNDIEITASTDDIQNRVENCHIYNLIKAYREHGHKVAKIDPLGLRNKINVPELDLKQYGLETAKLQDKIKISGLLDGLNTDFRYSLQQIIEFLNATYCGTISTEFSHLPNFEEKEWLAKEFESLQNIILSNDEKITIARDLIKSQVFENFLQIKFSTVKRYSGEGADSTITFFSELINSAPENGLSDIVIGMPHRGRLSLMTGLLEYPPIAIFQKMGGFSEFPPGSVGTGDVLSHLFTSVNLPNGIHAMLLPNPSHLEAVSPVTVGKARGRLQSLKTGDYSESEANKWSAPVLAVQVHGDGSFAGQGIVMETLAMANLPHFTIGGSLHLIVNNQLGFTTPTNRGNSSLYCSDLMKMIGAPVFHVNGDFPEDVAKVVRLALRYRSKFNKDVLVDLVCFRKHGHNEIDDPTYTNPIMYSQIYSRPQSVPDLYAKKLIVEGVWSESEMQDVIKSHTKLLNDHYQEIGSYQPQPSMLLGRWGGTSNPPTSITKWDTGVPTELLRYIGAKSVEVPDGFKVHRNLNRVLLTERPKKLSEGSRIDWATAETLAIGSLLYQGFNIRLSGQDVGRGTFSHRHAMLVDQETDEMIVPLNNMVENQKGFLEVANSFLSEEAILGFEYGMSIESPNNLVIWEAQFGDFFNGAQIIFDNFICSGETKWLYQSGLVILLPHGMDGAGPEHSSSHFERFLQMSDSREHTVDGDDRNWKIVIPTTPAQYFHILRRQMIQNFRKPLVVIAPKTLLRLPVAVSSLDDFQPNQTFSPVLGDPLANINADKIAMVILCSGKHYYELIKEREGRKRTNDVAIIRLEALCPFPATEISHELQKYKNTKTYVWSQEEHRNMGAWTFVRPRFENLLSCKLKYAGRKELSAAAVGIGVMHQKEVKEIMAETFSN